MAKESDQTWLSALHLYSIYMYSKICTSERHIPKTGHKVRQTKIIVGRWSRCHVLCDWTYLFAFHKKSSRCHSHTISNIFYTFIHIRYFHVNNISNRRYSIQIGTLQNVANQTTMMRRHSSSQGKRDICRARTTLNLIIYSRKFVMTGTVWYERNSIGGWFEP